VNSFWDWTKDTLAKGLRATEWYNGEPPLGLAGYINDFSSRMIGYATMRQLRVKNSNKNKTISFEILLISILLLLILKILAS
jgi:hypothetical protein